MRAGSGHIGLEFSLAQARRVIARNALRIIVIT
jgi:hypothetical protein